MFFCLLIYHLGCSFWRCFDLLSDFFSRFCLVCVATSKPARPCVDSANVSADFSWRASPWPVSLDPQSCRRLCSAWCVQSTRWSVESLSLRRVLSAPCGDAVPHDACRARRQRWVKLAASWMYSAWHWLVAPSAAAAAAAPAPSWTAPACSWTVVAAGCTFRLRLLSFCDLHGDYIHKLVLNFWPACGHSWDAAAASPRRAGQLAGRLLGSARPFFMDLAAIICNFLWPACRRPQRVVSCWEDYEKTVIPFIT